MKENAYALSGFDQLECSRIKKQKFRKQLIYTGDFVKRKDDGQEQRIPITEEDIDHFVSTGQMMLSNGLKVPMPIEHTEDPEANRGYITDFEKDVDEQGRLSLFGTVEFRDKDAAKMANSSDISIFVPPVQYDGNGNAYHRPIGHVALTTKPVIPGLMGFETIAASFSITPPDDDDDDDEFTLAEELGIELEEGEELTAQRVFDHFAEDTDDEDIPVEAAALSLLRENWQAKIKALSDVNSGAKITPAVADGLIEALCTDENLSLAYTSDSHAEMFDNLILSLSKNETLNFNTEDRSFGQDVIRLSNTDLLSTEKNPLLADAVSRSE